MEKQEIAEANHIEYADYGCPEYHFIGLDYYPLPLKICYVPCPYYSSYYSYLKGYISFI
jgi:hypothetical protein